MSPGAAVSSVATRLTLTEESPATSPPKRSVISRRLYDDRPLLVMTLGAAARTRLPPPLLFAVGKRFQHPVGDVDARAPIDRFLKDEIVFFAVGDLFDNFVGALEQAREFLITTHVQIFPVLALHALVVHAHARQLLLLRSALALAHRDAILLELGLRRLDLRLATSELLGTRSEFLLELLAGAFSRRRFAADALNVHVADLDVRRAGCRHHQQQRQDSCCLV